MSGEQSLLDDPKGDKLDELERRFEALREDCKAIIERLKVGEKENKKLRENIAILGSKVNGFPMQIEAFAQKFEEIDEKLGQSAEMWTEKKPGDVAKAIDRGFEALIAYKKGFEAKMDARRGGTQPTRAEAPARGEPSGEEPMPVALDISNIEWMQKQMQKVGLGASWAWAFAFDQDGDIKSETRQLVEAIEQYGSVRVGDHVIALGGRDGKLLQRKKA